LPGLVKRGKTPGRTKKGKIHDGKIKQKKERPSCCGLTVGKQCDEVEEAGNPLIIAMGAGGKGMGGVEKNEYHRPPKNDTIGDEG